MRRYQETVDLLVAIICEREHRPERRSAIGFARLDLDAPDDAIGAGRRGNLDAIVLLAIELDGACQVEGTPVEGHRDRLHRVGRQRHG